MRWQCRSGGFGRVLRDSDADPAADRAADSLRAAEIPLAEIYDWPDMDQRGVWNTSIKTPGFIP